jgi:hypothetical protein
MRPLAVRNRVVVAAVGVVGVPTRVAPSRPRDGLGGSGATCVDGRFLMLSVAVSEGRLEADLAADRLVCPDCSGRLSRWGFARSREVRLRAARTRAESLRVCAVRYALCAGPGRADRGHPGRQRARRRGRGDHARRPRAGVALRTSENAPDRAWELAVCITGGLLGGRPPLPP